MATSKFCITFAVLCLIGAVLCAPPLPADKVPQLINRHASNGEHSYEYGYQLDDGTSVFAHGELNTVNDEEVFVVSGHYEYKTPDGVIHKIEYTAGPEGFQVIKPPRKP